MRLLLRHKLDWAGHKRAMLVNRGWRNRKVNTRKRIKTTGNRATSLVFRAIFSAKRF